MLLIFIQSAKSKTPNNSEALLSAFIDTWMALLSATGGITPIHAAIERALKTEFKFNNRYLISRTQN